MPCQCEEMIVFSQCRPAWVCLCVRLYLSPHLPVFSFSEFIWKIINNNNNQGRFCHRYVSSRTSDFNNLQCPQTVDVSCHIITWVFRPDQTVRFLHGLNCVNILSSTVLFFITPPSPVVVIIQSNFTSTVQFPLSVSLIKHSCSTSNTKPRLPFPLQKWNILPCTLFRF